MNPLQLRQALECPVCYHIRRGPVFVCKRGHSVCGSCLARLPAAPAQLCPLARCGYDAPPRRNLTVERILAGSGLALDCDHADRGCLVTGVEEVLEEHLLECSFREVPCPVTYCQARIPLSELANHFAAANHRDIIPSHNGAWSLFALRDTRHQDFEVERVEDLGEDKDFVFYKHLVVREGVCYAWVQVMASASQAARFTCDISVWEISADRQQVHPVDRSVEEVLESGQYLALTLPQTRQHLTKSSGGDLEEIRCQPTGPRLPSLQAGDRMLIVHYQLRDEEEE